MRLATALKRLKGPGAACIQHSGQPCTGACTTAHFSLRPFGSAAQTGRPRLVILGSGWAAGSLTKDIDTSKYHLTAISSVNHLVFTPMLPGAAVGTVEERSTAISIFGIKPALKAWPNQFLTGEAVTVDPEKQRLQCRDALGGTYDVDYDLLAIATGAQGSTFGTPGVEEHCLFLRNVSNAADIRSALIRNWQLARSPGQSESEKKRLLTTLIVGGGPTGVEFAGELSDLISTELKAIDGARAKQTKVIIVEAQGLLGTFDSTLRDYAASKLKKQGIKVIENGIVKEVKATEALLNNGDRIPFGVCIWSTGVGPTDFVTSLPFAKTARGRLAVDEFLRVQVEAKGESPEALGPESVHQVDASDHEHHEKQQERKKQLRAVENVYALGDCSANIGTPLPALAQGWLRPVTR